MDIKGLDYNTQREKLVMSEYGREIQKMVDYAATLPTKEDRLKCAQTIIKMMETKMPQIRDNAGYEQALWDHLYLMSHKQLDIDWPFDVSNAERIWSRPQPIPLPQGNIRLRHYGKLVQDMLNELKDMPDDEERMELVRQTANQMKRDLMTWGHGSVDDEKVIDDMARLTDGKIQLDPNNFTFAKVTPLTDDINGKRGKKKK